MNASATAPMTKRMRVRSVGMIVPPCSPSSNQCRRELAPDVIGAGMTFRVTGCGTRVHLLRRDRLAISRLPTPGAGAVAALDHALLVDLRDDLAVASQQRLGRAHL